MVLKGLNSYSLQISYKGHFKKKIKNLTFFFFFFAFLVTLLQKAHFPKGIEQESFQCEIKQFSHQFSRINLTQ